MDDLQAFQNFKEAFDHFDWNNTKTIATSVSIEIHISHFTFKDNSRANVRFSF